MLHNTVAQVFGPFIVASDCVNPEQMFTLECLNKNGP